jgi:hypothetical protein
LLRAGQDVFILCDHSCLHGFLGWFGLQFALLDPSFAHFSLKAVKFHFQMLTPLIFAGGNALEWLLIRVIEVVGQLLPVLALLELGLRHSGDLSEVAIVVEDLVDLVLDFCFKIEILQKFGDRFLNLVRGTVASDLLRIFAVGFDKLVFK